MHGDGAGASGVGKDGERGFAAGDGVSSKGKRRAHMYTWPRGRRGNLGPYGWAQRLEKDHNSILRMEKQEGKTPCKRGTDQSLNCHQCPPALHLP